MRRNTRVAALLLLVALLGGPATSEPPHVVDRALDRLEGWGLSGAVIHGQGDKTLSARGFGQADRASGEAFSPRTRIPWHSVSKSATAATLLQLEQAGALSLEDRLSVHFDELPAPHGRIRIRELLTHTSGLAAQLAHPAHEGPPELEAIDRAELERRAFASEPMADPGVGFRYSNLGYNLAAAVAERTVEGDFAELVAEKLLTPAGLGASGIGGPAGHTEEAVGYTRGESWGRFSERAWPDGRPGWNLMGSGAIAGPVTEMAAWIQVLRADGPLDERQRRRWREAQVDKGGGRGYALGWSTTRETPAGPRIGHEGGFGPFTSKLAWWPEPDHWLAVSLNSDRFHAQDIAEALERLIGDEEADLPPTPGDHPLPEDWKDWAGEERRFVASGGNEWRVHQRDDTLMVRAYGPDAVGPIAWPEGEPPQLAAITGDLMLRLRGLARGDGGRPPARDARERATMVKLAEWLAAHCELPISRLEHLGTVARPNGSELETHLALEGKKRIAIHMNRQGHWRSIDTDVERAPARAIYRMGGGGGTLRGMEATRLRAAGDMQIDPRPDVPEFRTPAGLRLTCPDCGK